MIVVITFICLLFDITIFSLLEIYYGMLLPIIPPSPPPGKIFNQKTQGGGFLVKRKIKY